MLVTITGGSVITIASGQQRHGERRRARRDGIWTQHGEPQHHRRHGRQLREPGGPDGGGDHQHHRHHRPPPR
ncbi:MAG: hypothetical protein IPN05_19825 [Sulfuritalea sp.]|nr:hypothetical protein [Sulfuritalea sp.]